LPVWEKAHARVTMQKSWLEEGRVGKPGGHGGVDQDRVKIVEILRRSTAFCPKEKAYVPPIDSICIFWKPRENLKQAAT